MEVIIILLMLFFTYMLGNIFVYLIKKESKVASYIGAGLYLLIAIDVVFIAYKINYII